MRPIIGIDEAGRGSWAGPLTAAAVCVDRGWSAEEVADSKSLSRSSRQVCLRLIQTSVLAIGIGWVMPDRIDEIGLQAATSLAMKTAMGQITIDEKNTDVVIDGHINYLSDVPNTTALIKADETVAAVSAASIVAKCYRDNYMTAVASVYSNYGFDNHAGYGTAGHKASLLRYGCCKLHRLSFAPVKAARISNKQ